MTLLDDLFQTGAQRPAATAVASSRLELDHASLRRRVLQTAAWLQAHGVRRGDRVALQWPNSVEYVVAFLGIYAAGATVVPLDPCATEERLRGLLELTQPRRILVSTQSELRSRSDTLVFDLELLPERESAPLERAGVAALILFSAGSTGVPKGAVLHDQHLRTIAATLVDVMQLHPGHRELIVSPMTHSGGWQRVTASLLAGGSVFIADVPISMPALLEVIEQREIEGLFASPPLMRMLLQMPAERLRSSTASLRCLESASAPLSAAELAQLLERMPATDVFFQYGLTECSRAFILDARRHPDKLHTVGLPTAGVRVRIADDQDRPLEPGGSGQILLTAPQRAEEYFRRPDLNRDRFVDGWLRTHDQGRLDREGFLVFEGRKDDLINCGGLSFFPAEAEHGLGEVDGVRDYLIAGVEDPLGILHQVPWAFVVADQADWSPATFLQAARSKLPPHMVPRHVVTVPSIPESTTGKRSRSAALALYGPES